MASERPADDARDVHDNPDKSDSESPEETMRRHEELHHEHRARIDHIMGKLGLEEPEDDVRGIHDKPDRSDSTRDKMLRRKRHS